MNKRYHAIYDCKNVIKETCGIFRCCSVLNDKGFIKKFLLDVVKLVDMNILDGPRIKYGNPEFPGITGTVIIDFSDIIIHTWPEENTLCFEVFSCKPYSYKKVYDFVKSSFDVKDKDIKNTSGIVDYETLRRIK